MEDISGFFADVEKTFGKGSVILGNNVPDVPKLSSGILSIDIASGGGYGLGRIVEAYGGESVGKSTLSIYGMISAQNTFPDKYVGLIDAEHAFDIEYAKKLGLKEEGLIISQPDNGEQGLEILEKMIRSNKFSFLVVDSVAALTPKSEIDGEMGDSSMGTHARLMSKAMRKITAAANSANCVVFFINQTRSKIGVMFGNPETTTGGNALKFYASQRIELTRSQGAKNDQGELSSNKIKAKFVKNKLASPFKVAEYDIVFGEGIVMESDVLNLADKYGFIKKSGSWFSLNDESGTKLGQGREGAIATLKDNPDLLDLLVENIKAIAFGNGEE